MILVPGGPVTRLERIGLALALVLAAVLMWPVRDYITDTAYVWLRYADHLARGQGLVFNLGERVYGCTSPLWVALMADGIALGLDGLGTARVLGALATLASVGLFMQLMRRTVRSPAVRAVATVVWAGHAGMLQWSCSGLETPLAVALTLAGFVALTEGQPWGERPVRTGSLWALAALTRPGAVLLLALWFTTLLVDANNRPAIRRLVFGIAPAVVIYGAWLLAARLYFGSFWPQVLAIVPAGEAGWGHSLTRLVQMARLIAPTDGVMGAALLAALALGGPRMWPLRRWTVGYLPWLWVVGLPALYAARGVPVESRHLLLVIPVAHWLAWRAVESWWAGDPPSPRGPVRVGVLAGLLGALVLALNVATYRGVVLPEVRRTSSMLRAGPLAWGQWLGHEAARSAVIASPLPGAVGWGSGLQVLDLSGLLSPQMTPVVHRIRARDIVPTLAFETVGRPEYVLDAADPSAMLSRTPYRAAFQPLRERSGLALYRLHWDAVDSLRSLP